MCLFQGRQCVLRFRAAKASACLRADDGDTCGRRSPLEASFLCLLLSPHQLIFLGHLVRLVVLSPRSIQTLMCRHFVIVGFGGGAAGRFFMVCRQLVDPCFHLSLSLLVGWEDGSRPPPGTSGCRYFTPSFCALVPTLVGFECCWMRRSWGSGDAGELLPPLDCCGCS
jgi:hypothetical protein